jgi:hypothetical protein
LGDAKEVEPYVSTFKLAAEKLEVFWEFPDLEFGVLRDKPWHLRAHVGVDVISSPADH